MKNDLNILHTEIQVAAFIPHILYGSNQIWSMWFWVFYFFKFLIEM